MNAVSTLEHIETVMLDIVMTNVSNEYNAKEGLELAEGFMGSCPSLHRFSFGAPVSSIYSQQCRMYPSYVRSAGGKVQLEGFDIVNKDSWRDGV
jgi:hypothetical protein